MPRGRAVGQHAGGLIPGGHGFESRSRNKNRSELSGSPTLRLVHEYLELIEHLSGHGRVMVALLIRIVGRVVQALVSKTNYGGSIPSRCANKFW